MNPPNLYAEIFSVKAVLNNYESFHLVDTGLSGPTKAEIYDGFAYFSGLKFSSTSYKNNVIYHCLA